MPVGRWRRKQSKRKETVRSQQSQESQDSPTNPNPHGASGKEEVEETFQTPKLQPDLIDESSASRKKGEIKVNTVEVPFNGEGSSGVEDLNGYLEMSAVESVPVIVVEETPKFLIQPVEACCSNEKDAKVVPLSDEGTAPVASVGAVRCEDGEDVDTNGRLKIEALVDETVKDTKLENSAENSEDVESICASSAEKEVRESSHVNAASETFNDAVETESQLKIEIARDPPVVRRSSLWNCCGLFEVITGSGS